MSDNEVKAPAPKVFYFGCLDNGHHLYDADGEMMYRQIETPWGEHPDGVLCPDERLGQLQGKALLHQKDGWTAIGFWDRTGDSRPGSNSAFMVRGTFTFDEICRLAAAQFPTVWHRIGNVSQ
jgi:hypothetical protein